MVVLKTIVDANVFANTVLVYYYPTNPTRRRKSVYHVIWQTIAHSQHKQFKHADGTVALGLLSRHQLMIHRRHEQAADNCN